MTTSARLPFPLPQFLKGFEGSEEGRAWLAGLPLLLDASSEAWQLELGEPFPDASASLTVPAALETGARPC